ncbi:BTAD domain-containing putative transcriptional regulator [Streptomyces sp. NPDC059037]|uniref:AfsR/SARP family transcriptional regulator n=1 Tax=Streptomyces sp. NPDC059037 TaxID=3346710 RepID=UPI0036A3D794
MENMENPSSSAEEWRRSHDREEVLDFDGLGPLLVLSGGRRLHLGPPRQRAVLGLLLINANHLLSADSIIESIWEGEPPPQATAALYAYLSRLRRSLSGEGWPSLLVRQNPGYVLAVSPEQMATHRFERAVSEGERFLRQGDHRASGRLMADALGMWRDTPYADLGRYDFSARESVRLEAVRLVAVEGLAESLLSQGDPHAVVGLLYTEIQANPFRENLVHHFMTALYLSGRRVDALKVYEQTRSRLAGEMGVDPGKELRDLHQDVLQQNQVRKRPSS